MSARDLTPAERRERGTTLCRQLAEEVARIAPPGLGRWDRAWEIVGPPSADFMAALTAWEADPSPRTKEAVSEAYVELVYAWRRGPRVRASPGDGMTGPLERHRSSGPCPCPDCRARRREGAEDVAALIAETLEDAVCPCVRRWVRGGVRRCGRGEGRGAPPRLRAVRRGREEHAGRARRVQGTVGEFVTSLDRLAERWEDDAELLRRYGAEEAAAAVERTASELREALQEADRETLTPEEAADLGGYSNSHLQHLVADGTIPNVGEAGAPRIRRSDVPRKPGHGSDARRSKGKGALLDRSVKLHREREA